MVYSLDVPLHYASNATPPFFQHLSFIPPTLPPPHAIHPSAELNLDRAIYSSAHSSSAFPSLRPASSTERVPTLYACLAVYTRRNTMAISEGAKGKSCFTVEWPFLHRKSTHRRFPGTATKKANV
ncbi:hypothetical protein NMY22_g13603 [Coprinellus aureogranulatus]|nr:hypothetical protein NMY22_g13603 [Coprinellus aureogranulatus]